MIILSSCSKNLIGTYTHNICCFGPNCYILTLKDNNKFEYKYGTDLMGSGIIYGNYKRKINRLILNQIYPNEYNLQKPLVNFEISPNSDTTEIQFYILPPILIKTNNEQYKELDLNTQNLNVIDTIKCLTFIKINQTDYYTDTIGYIKVKLHKNDTIKIQEFFNLNYPYTYIIPDENITKLNIYYSGKPFNPLIFDWFVKEYKIKKYGFVPLSYEPEMAFFGNYSYLNKYKCLGSREREIIRDSLFQLISKNIDIKVFDYDYSDENFLIYFNKKGKVKKVTFEPLFDTKIENWYYDFLGYKQRRAIRKTLKNYKIPVFDEIKYNFVIYLELDYDYKTKELKLFD